MVLEHHGQKQQHQLVTFESIRRFQDHDLSCSESSLANRRHLILKLNTEDFKVLCVTLNCKCCRCMSTLRARSHTFFPVARTHSMRWVSLWPSCTPACAVEKGLCARAAQKQNALAAKGLPKYFKGHGRTSEQVMLVLELSENVQRRKQCPTIPRPPPPLWRNQENI